MDRDAPPAPLHPPATQIRAESRALRAALHAQHQALEVIWAESRRLLSAAQERLHEARAQSARLRDGRQ